jgi:hypothetical protein
MKFVSGLLMAVPQAVTNKFSGCTYVNPGFLGYRLQP